MLCFEILKNGRKLALAGVRESGVITVMLSWAGRGRGASARAAAAVDGVPDLDFQVGGIDSSGPGDDADIEWVQSKDLRLGDEILIRIGVADAADAPARHRHLPISRNEGEVCVVECSFCGHARRSDSEKAGIAGAEVFICARCAVLAERLLDDKLPELFHLRRGADATCSFCGTERTAETAEARASTICGRCADMTVKELLFP